MWKLSALLAVVVLSSAVFAQTTPVPLNYNFNGIVHAGEAGAPDAPSGYRSIADRGLDFTAGVPAVPLLAPYAIIGSAGVLDIVHLGNRNTVAGGLRAFDVVVDGDNNGIQPTWLVSPDQTGPQTTTLGAPIVVPGGGLLTRVKALCQISNGGGSFDITLGFMGGGTLTGTVSAPDWFGGSFLATGSTDLASPSGNLSITEVAVDISSMAGDSLTSITFENASNANAGIAILAANVESITPINSFPYLEDFEASGGGYTAAGVNSSWEYGTPANAFISAAASGTGAWVTSLAADHVNNENSYLESPPIDCSSFAFDPILTFSLIYETEPCCDEAFVEISINSGAFTRLGTGAGSDPSFNWYNDFTNNWWDGVSSGWVTALQPLSGAAGNTIVLRWRFSSDISIVNEGMGVDDVKIEAPMVGSGQPALPGGALFDCTNAVDIQGFGTSSGRPGPYTAMIPEGTVMTWSFDGEANQPFILLTGALNVGVNPIPPFGQLDIGAPGLTGLGVFGNGFSGGFFNALFRMLPSGSTTMSFAIPVGLAGGGLTAQPIMFNLSLGGIGIANVVDIMIIP